MTLPTYTAIFEAMGQAYGLSPRASQLKLSEYVRSAVMTGGVCCIEAPTGTGKTLGYIAGALDAQAHSGNPVPIVVATATVGLQEQILRDDVPRLAAVGALDPRKVAVAKGRGRYFCPRTAALLEDKKMRDNQFDMFHEDKHVADGGTPIALDMLRAWRDGTWDGDRDSWPGLIPECWGSACGASSDTCVNRACEHFDKCPYMASRQKLATAQLIVANHDIVLADLKQRSEEQSNTVLPPKKYALIVDEAHNLPDKAISTRSASANLTDSDWLRKLEAYGETNLNTPRIAKVLKRAVEFQADIFSVGAALLVNNMDLLAQNLNKNFKFDANGTCTWGLSIPDKAVQDEVVRLSAQANQLVMALQAMAKAYAEYAEEAVGVDKAFAVRMLSQTHTHQRMAMDLYAGLELFSAPDRMVRWVSRNKHNHVVLHSQPLEGQEVLNDLLWKTEMPVALVSATLQIAGSFERFRAKSGLPARAVTAALDPVFDYSRGFLHQPKMDTSPSDPGFELEVTEKLEILFKKEISKGMLVLFTARESMRRVVRALPDSIATRVLVQDHRPVPELIALHKERVDSGEHSMLVGMDTMSEGLDLPGKYCGHVVIVRLPFSPPGDPVEEARREHLGKHWFKQAYLADMLTNLIQATGRLIRRESDHGVITILDSRLATKRYALDAVNALPGFTRGIKISEYFKMAEKRGFDLTFGAGAPKPAAKLALVTPATPAPVKEVVDVVARPVAPEPVKDPLSGLWAAAKRRPSATRAAVAVDVDSLEQALIACMPFSKGPFAAGEVPYLIQSDVKPCLPVGTPAVVWAERQLPQAVMLGLRLRNQEWQAQAPAWQQVLSLRPDLVQFAQVLRSHLRQLLDERTVQLPEAVCREQMAKGLSGLGAGSDDELIEFLDRLEGEVVDILAGAHILPCKELLLEMPVAAQALAKALRRK